MRYDFWIAWRYMLSRRFGSFGGLIMVVSIFGIAIAIFSLVIIMSVMNGFNDELTDRLLGFDPHLTIVRNSDDAIPVIVDEVKEWISSKDLDLISPYVEGEVIAESRATGEPLAQGARLRGIDLGDGGILYKLGAKVSRRGDGSGRIAIIGNEIVMQLGVYPGFEDVINITAPLADIGPTGELVPNRSEFEVDGAFRTGIYNWDSKYILTDIASARNVLGMQAREGFLVWLTRYEDVDHYEKIFARNMPEGWKVESWKEQNQRLFSALKLERFAMAAVLAMALLISSFGISVIVLMIVSSKKKDIAILRSIGMSGRDIRNIFLMNAGIIGASGSVLGTSFGIVVCILMKFYPPALPASYYLDSLPVEINPFSTFLFSLTGVLVALAAALYPVKKAMMTDVVEVLRYE